MNRTNSAHAARLPRLASALAAAVIVAAGCTSPPAEEPAPQAPTNAETEPDDVAVTVDGLPEEADEADSRFVRTDEAPEAEFRPIGEEQLILEVPVVVEPYDNRLAAVEYYLWGRPPEPGFSEQTDLPHLINAAAGLCDALGLDLTDPEQGEVVRGLVDVELSAAAGALLGVNDWFRSQGEKHLRVMIRSTLSSMCPAAAWAAYTEEMAARLDARWWTIDLDTEKIAVDASVWAAFGDIAEVNARVTDPGIPEEAVLAVCVGAEASVGTVGDILDELLEGRPGAAGSTDEEREAVGLAKTAAISAAVRQCPAIMWSRLWSEPSSSDAGIFTVEGDRDLLKSILEEGR